MEKIASDYKSGKASREQLEFLLDFLSPVSVHNFGIFDVGLTERHSGKFKPVFHLARLRHHISACLEEIRAPKIHVTLSDEHAALLDWYIRNISDIRVGGRRVFFETTQTAAQYLRRGQISLKRLTDLHEALQPCLYSNYAKHFTVPVGIPDKDDKIVSRRLDQLRSLTQSLLDASNS